MMIIQACVLLASQAHGETDAIILIYGGNQKELMGTCHKFWTNPPKGPPPLGDTHNPISDLIMAVELGLMQPSIKQQIYLILLIST